MFKTNQFLCFQGIVLSSSLLLIIVSYFGGVTSHGMMLEPVNRGSLWRFDRFAPKDYNDNAGFCGGFYTQWTVYGGKCGYCGDSYGQATPRSHEHGGTYGRGVIVRNYTAGESVEISVRVTVNHKGYFIFHLCNLDNKAESEECFSEEPLALREGGFEYHLQSFQPGMFNTTVVIPSDVICNHCVLRWTYNAGNSWGTCADGSSGVGCGPQEQFKGCADVAIFPPKDALYNAIPY